MPPVALTVALPEIVIFEPSPFQPPPMPAASMPPVALTVALPDIVIFEPLSLMPPPMPALEKPPLALRVPFPTISNSRFKLLIPAFSQPFTTFVGPSESSVVTFVSSAHSSATPMAAPGAVGFIDAPLRAILTSPAFVSSVIRISIL